jgi:histone H3/H4
MNKNKEKDNTLIKRKKLIILLKTEGINRITPSALQELDKNISEEIQNMAKKLKEKMVIDGRKTLLIGDVKQI